MKTKKLNTIVKFYIIPAFLLGIWVILTLIHIFKTELSPTVILHEYSSSELPEYNTDFLLKGEMVQFPLHASYDNLGMILIQFNTYDRFNEDYIVFRIKEIDAKNWYYENKYYTKEFTNLQKYPFGFPLISDSKNKKYVVEIESLNGNLASAVGISNNNPVLTAGYKFDKNKLLTNTQYLEEFIRAKIYHSFINNYLLFTSSIFLYPFILYISWYIFEERFLLKKFKKYYLKIFPKQTSNPYIVLLLIGIIFDTFFVDSFFDLIFIVIPMVWIITLFRYYKKNLIRITYGSALVLLTLMPFLQFFHLEIQMEKAASWAFLLLLVSVIYDIYLLNTRSSNTKNRLHS